MVSSTQPTPEYVRLRYRSASVFERANLAAQEVAQLARGDPFTVLGTEGEFYQVRLPGGAVGFVYAHNVLGSNMPPTASEQLKAHERAALAAQPPCGWRAMLGRLHRRLEGR